MAERLQKVISQAGIASRRHAEDLIVNGRVTVNGKLVNQLGAKVEPGRDVVAVDGKQLRAERKVYIMLNKPKGVVATLRDPEGRKTIADLTGDLPVRVFPVGRLDYNTEGLLLLTNDGVLTQALLHPSREIPKTYLAEVVGRPSEEVLDKLRVGVGLSDGMTAPARVRIIGWNAEKVRTQLEIIIHEGQNRQVRRMCEAIGHPVEKLKRTKFAFLTLEGVRRGHYRHLDSDEVTQLRQVTGLTPCNG